jgi:ribosomal protein L36
MTFNKIISQPKIKDEYHIADILRGKGFDAKVGNGKNRFIKRKGKLYLIDSIDDEEKKVLD